MSSFQTNLGDNNTKASTTGKCGSTSQTKGKVNEDSEMNLFLSDESSGNDIDEASGEASGETSGETSNGNSSNSEKSKSSISTTEAWFREFNQNTKELNKSNFDDDDSETPYYKSHPKPMSNQQSSVISRHHQHSQRIGHHARIPPNRNIPKSPRHGNFHKKRGESSGSDSYRSVIDDLTLKNQKLRQKLRKLERIHAKSLHKEKLFEVRYYQMPSEKRHELEEYLRQFAAQLSTPNSSSTQLTQNSTNTIGNDVTPDISYIKAGDKSKMKQVVRAIENVFTTKPSLDDHYLKDQEDADPQGYVYLNLLTNMAQLHTMSVTLPFVKQAIRTFSNCLELNEDGTKVRWLTGLDHVKPDQFSANKVKDVDIIGSGGSSENTSRSGVSEISSAGDKQSDFSPSNPSAEFQNSKNFTNAYITPSSLTSSNTSTAINQQTKSTSSISHYRPVLIHRSSSSSDETSSETDHDGPVIYYEGGLFCTDLSRNVITDDVKQTHSPGTQSSPGLDNSIVDDNNIDISEERRNVPHYERATNSILGGSGVILNETIDEDSCSGQEADDESPTKLCDQCGVNDHDSLICPHMSIDDPKLSMIAVDDSNENSKDTNDGINRILMEKDIEFTHRTQSDSFSGENYGEINEWNEDVSKNSSSSPTSHSNQYIPAYKKLFTAKVPGITTEDNFMLLVQTSHPPREKISRSKESSVDSSTDMGQQKNEKSQRSHKIISTKLFQLPPSMSPQPRTSPPPGVKRTSFTTSSKTSSSDSGGSSGYGSSSSYSNTFSESSSATSRDNSYLLRNNTLLQLSQSNNSNRRDLVSSQDDEIQDMELDSLSSDSSDPSPFINIDADEDEEMETKDDENHNHRIEESKLGMDLRFHDAVVEERRKLVDKVAPQEQRFRLLNDIMASSRAMVEALKDNKNDNDVIDGGMDSLPTIPLPFFNQQYNFFDQQQSNSGGINNFINGINGIINQNNNYNNNNNNNNNNNAL